VIFLECNYHNPPTQQIIIVNRGGQTRSFEMGGLEDFQEDNGARMRYANNYYLYRSGACDKANGNFPIHGKCDHRLVHRQGVSVCLLANRKKISYIKHFFFCIRSSCLFDVRYSTFVLYLVLSEDLFVYRQMITLISN